MVITGTAEGKLQAGNRVLHTYNLFCNGDFVVQHSIQNLLGQIRVDQTIEQQSTETQKPKEV